MLVLAAVQPLSRAAPAAAQSPVPQDAEISRAAGEFPPYDSAVWGVQREGLLAAAAARSLREAPDSVATLDALLQARRVDDALKVLRTIIDSRPDRLIAALEHAAESAYAFRQDVHRGRPNGLRDVADAVRQRLPDLSKEDAARAARALAMIDHQVSREASRDWLARLQTFARDYKGTETALLTEIDIVDYTQAREVRLDAYDAFARDYPRSVVGAKALFMKGFRLRSAPPGANPLGGDPTDRFLRVIEIVKELESGAYPECRWTRDASSLVVQFSTLGAKYAPGNIDRMLDAYRAFAVSHFAVDDNDAADEGIGYVITGPIAELYSQRGEAIIGMERFLVELEGRVSTPLAVRYLRAMFYTKRARSASGDDRIGLLQKARETLRTLHAEDSGLYQRKALATLAAMEFHERQYSAARDAYRKYLELYPQSAWAWVASMRMGQSEEALDNWPAAANAHRAAATTFASVPLARMLGHVYVARANEALGQFDQAMLDYQRALDSWDDNFGPAPYLSTVHHREPNEPPLSLDEKRVTKLALADRLAQLKRSLGQPRGHLLEQGRWSLDQGRLQQARTTLEHMVATYPRSEVIAEARYLTHRVRLEAALQLGEIDQPAADEAKTIRELDALASEPYDFAVAAAKIAKATLLWKQGASASAEQLMTEALSEWHMLQTVTTAPPAGTLERDVLEIRDVVFRPRGGGVYDGSRWNAFEWPSTLPSVVVARSELSVLLPDGARTSVSIRRPFPQAERALFLDADHIALLTKIMTTLGGTKTRPPRAIMETPHQPIGPSMDILALWNRFFPARPGHWGGWIFETFPIVTQIELLDDARTKAEARVTIGYAGTTVTLEKRDGVWHATGLVNTWIT